jgi:mono/diheme cytochrome c family protein
MDDAGVGGCASPASEIGAGSFFFRLSRGEEMSGCWRRAATGCMLGVFWWTVAGCGGARHGEELFDLRCADCHREANPDLKKRPPSLEGLFRSKTLPSGAPATDTQVRKTVVEGLGTMPAFDRRLSENDVNDLIQYLHTLK